MTQLLRRVLNCRNGTRRLTLLLALSPAAALAAVATSPALAANPELTKEFEPFAHCPVTTAAVCLVADTTSGEFKIGSKTVPIEKPILLQGGLATVGFGTEPLIGAVGAETLSKTPLTLPGGLVGIAGLGGEVTATAELVGPPSSILVSKINLLSGLGPAVVLQVKVKLSNEVLGNECYIGSDTEPIVLHLTTGTTSPPSPAQPITGKLGTKEGRAKGKILAVKNTTLVDNTFSAPGATGCGGSLSAVIDPIVNLDAGLPAAAGSNTAIMNGSLEETLSKWPVKYKPKVKKK